MTNPIVKLQLNVDLGKLKKGTIVSTPCDEHGTPFDPYWRNRVKDSVHDNCVEVINDIDVEMLGKQTKKQNNKTED